MKETPDIHKNCHSVYNLKYHLVIVTKYRKWVLVGEVCERLLVLTKMVFEQYWNCTIETMETDGDHIHILFEAPPQVQLSKLVGNYKTVTSRLLKKEFPGLKNELWKEMFWNRSYYIGSVGTVDTSVIHDYIECQQSKPRKRPL